MKTIALSLDGYTDLPAGKIANVVTFLERTGAPPQKPPLPDGIRIRRVERPDTAWYRAIYRRVGENWLWFSRAVMADGTLAAILAAPETTILVMERGAETAAETLGFVEIDFVRPDEVELFAFGLVPEATGKGLARPLMQTVLAELGTKGATRVWLHTCTFDHPAAVPFYRSCGFRPYKFAIEVSDDPRLTGALPPTAAPHVPLLKR
jgi:GNAT superfamily N-acetyltransferase